MRFAGRITAKAQRSKARILAHEMFRTEQFLFMIEGIEWDPDTKIAPTACLTVLLGLDSTLRRPYHFLTWQFHIRVVSFVMGNEICTTAPGATELRSGL